jgi:hypothetical protein
MYYLDLFQLYKSTTRSGRSLVRLSLNRDVEMARKLHHQHNKCFFCGCEITMADHLDHLVPVYYGGKSTRGNLVASCRSCNLLKSTQQIEITNPYTIKDYQRLIEAKLKWQHKLKANPRLKRYQPKRVRLYKIFHADLFRHLH